MTMMNTNEITKITKRYQALCELVPLKHIVRKAEYAAADMRPTPPQPTQRDKDSR